MKNQQDKHALLNFIQEKREMNMKKVDNQKLYFESVDDTSCQMLEDYLHDARLEGKTEITLVEAIPDLNNPDYIWCSYHGEVGERSECKKALCDDYTSKSGRGKCEHRGSLYQHGEEVTFQVPKA